MVRAIRLFLLLVCLGIASTIGVAWALAYLVQPPSALAADPGAAGFRSTRAYKALPADTTNPNAPTHWLARAYEWSGARDVVVVPVSGPGLGQRDFAGVLPYPEFEAEVDSRALAAKDDFAAVNFAWDARGWPWLALSSHWPWFAQTAWPNPPVEDGIQIGSPPTPMWPNGISGLRALPLRPLPAGFLADTLVFAALWGLIPLGAAVRRELRRRSHRCPACAHSLSPGQATCPECGKPSGIAA